MNFTKMHGNGNDFVLIDNRDGSLSGLSEISKRLCHRRFGIGADQVLVLEDSEKADFRMLIYNADGSEVEMCGNGIRAFAKYIWDRSLSEKEVLDVETLAGIIKPERRGKLVRVDMGPPELDGRRIPVNRDGRVIDHLLEIEDLTFEITCVSMGNPHAVIFVDSVDEFPVEQYGRVIENHELFPNRINVEFTEVVDRKTLRMRVWERGSGETLACGTGASASAVAAIIKGLTENEVTIKLLGGDLLIEWAGEGANVFMTGPAEEVFTGTISI
jgi:diaminopimelate epimerase